MGMMEIIILITIIIIRLLVNKKVLSLDLQTERASDQKFLRK